MKPLLLGVFSIAMSVNVLAAPRTWTFGDGTLLRLNLPDGVTCEQVSPPEDKEHQAFTLRAPDINKASTISYQFLVTKADPSTDWSTVDKIDAFLLQAGRRGLQGSVEKELKPIHLKMKTGAGSYLIFTDADLFGKMITTPGAFRHMTMVACGIGGYNIFIRGYTNSKIDSYFTRMNQMIENAEIVAKK